MVGSGGYLTYIFHAEEEFFLVAFAHFVTHPEEFLIFENPVLGRIILEYF